MAEEFGGETFFPSPFIGLISTTQRERQAVLVDIEARPQVSHLIIDHTPEAVLPGDGTFNNKYWFYHINTSGVLTSSVTFTEFADKTDHYVNISDPPVYLIFLDENGDSRYVYADPGTGTLNVQGTKPIFSKDHFQYVGDYLEMIGENATSIYRITATSSNTLSVDLNRDEPDRNKTIRVSHGHPYPFDGTNLYDESLLSLGKIATRIPNLESGFGGVAIPTLSEITLKNADGRYSFLAHQSFDSRSVTVRTGKINEDISIYPVIFQGKTERVESDLDYIRISLRDPSILFNKSIQQNTYAGSGVLEGSGELQGVLKPLSIGLVRQADPVLVYPYLDIYQMHDGPVHDIFTVLEGGIERVDLGDISNRSENDLTEWTPTQAEINQGSYLTDNARGMFRLASPPNGRITASTSGSSDIPIGWPLTNIIQYIINSKLPSITIDADSFDEFNTDRGWESGIYITEDKTILEALNELIAPLRATLLVDSNGNAMLKRLKITEAKYAIVEGRNTRENSYFKLRPAKKAGSSYRIGYNRIWADLTESDMLSGAMPALKDRLINKWKYVRTSISEDNNTRLPVFESAKRITTESLIIDSSILEQVIANRFQDYSQLNLFQVTVFGFDFLVQVGDTVLVQHSALNLGNIHHGIVVEVIEDDPTSTDEGKTNLLIWV